MDVKIFSKAAFSFPSSGQMGRQRRWIWGTLLGSESLSMKCEHHALDLCNRLENYSKVAEREKESRKVNKKKMKIK